MKGKCFHCYHVAPFSLACRGIGLDRLFVKFLKLYSDPHTLVLVIGTSPAHEVRRKGDHYSSQRDWIARINSLALVAGTFYQ